MNKHFIQIKKVLISGLLICALLFLLPQCISNAAEDMEEHQTSQIKVPFYTPGIGVMEYDFPYSDDYFMEPADIFSRDIAKASLGLMVSAFRKSDAAELSNQYKTYLNAAGFKDIYAFGYDQQTSTDSLSGVIAHKQIGDFVLIAASPCGQGYGKEWAGNLEIGNGGRHEGFDKAAKIMESEIDGYIEEHDLGGLKKLWLAGFSRAAAVSNITAADEIESGKFDDVYAYLYGVPRTTKSPVDYPGIYNICGKYDPVTMVPLESWGYGRYGTTLYLPAAETDIRYPLYVDKASGVCYDIADEIIRYNPEQNYQFHLIMEFIGEMFPDTGEYVDKMQEKVMEVWQEADPDHMLEIIASVFEQLDDLDQRQEYSSDVFIEYLTSVISKRIKDATGSTELRDLVWDKDQPLYVNLLREHMPYIYMSWIFSDNTDDELFGSINATRRVSLSGDVDVSIWKDDHFIIGYKSNGEYIHKDDVDPEEADVYYIEDIFAVKNGEETLVFMPYDVNAEIRITAHEGTDIFWYESVCEADKTYSDSGKICSAALDKGEYRLDYYGESDDGKLKVVEGRVIGQETDYLEYSPTLVMSIESGANENITLGGFVLQIFFTACFTVLLLLVCLIIAIVHKIRRKKHGPYSPLFVIVPHLIFFVLFVIITYYVTANLYLITIARVISAAISMLAVFLLALRGLLRNRNIKNIILTGIVLAAGILNCTIYQKSSMVSSQAGQFVVYCVLMAVIAVLAVLTFRREKHKGADYTHDAPGI